MKSLGVDTVRVTVLWETVAENARFLKADIAKLRGEKNTRAREAARRQNKRFKPANPSTYPIRNWDRYDNLVRAAQARGIRVYFNVTGPGPKWAHAKKPKGSSASQRTYKPKAREFKLFVTAVGKRYSGTYSDENGSRIGAAAREHVVAVERAQPGRLAVAAVGERQAGLARDLPQALPAGLRGPRRDRPPRRQRHHPRSVRRRRWAATRRPASRRCGPSSSSASCLSGDLWATELPATGFAHHPYTKNIAPNVRDPHPDSLTMANISELGTLLDEMSARTGGKVAAGLPLFMTEYGFETNPPDPFSGVSPALQAKYNTLGEYMAYLNPRIASQAQFLLKDVPPVKGRNKKSKGYWFTYQSGLYHQRGQPKEAAYAYAFPFVATATPTDPVTGQPKAHLWGQLRFQATGVADSVLIQWKPYDGSADWVTVGDPVPSDPTRGYFEADRTAPVALPGFWRAIWLDATGNVGLYTGPSDGLS